MSLLVLLTLTKLKHWLTNHSRIIPTYLHIPYASISQDFYCSKIRFTTSICRYILITSSLHPHCTRCPPWDSLLIGGLWFTSSSNSKKVLRTTIFTELGMAEALEALEALEVDLCHSSGSSTNLIRPETWPGKASEMKRYFPLKLTLIVIFVGCQNTGPILNPGRWD